MNILFILPEYYPHSGAGISTYYEQYIRALIPHCKKIKVIVGSGYIQADDVFERDGITIEYLKPSIYRKYLEKFTQYDLLPEFKKNIASAWAMWEQSNKGDQYDIIECTDFGLGFIPWVINHSKPIITRLHGSSGQITLHESILSTELTDRFVQLTELSLLPACDKLITHSKANQIFWNDLLNSTNVIHINPIYNEIENEILSFSQRDPHGLVTARIQKWKGPIELCKAFALLTDDQKPIINWFGQDKIYSPHQSTSDYLKSNFPSIWNRYIIPHDPLPNQQIHALQQKAKFGVISSTWDMFNFTCVEFMMKGTPVICSDGAGSVDLIEHGKNGFIYHSNDIQSLSECIKTVTSLNKQQYNKISNAARETIKNELSAYFLIQSNLQLYYSTLASFKIGLSNAYWYQSYNPSEIQYDIGNILDKQPLKKLTNYFIKRLRNKYK